MAQVIAWTLYLIGFGAVLSADADRSFEISRPLKIAIGLVWPIGALIIAFLRLRRAARHKIGAAHNG